LAEPLSIRFHGKRGKYTDRTYFLTKEALHLNNVEMMLQTA